nr:MAG TPA: hypothetical protein [Caudoviricetes sp.]
MCKCLIDKFVGFINICKSVWCMLHTLFYILS